MGSPLELGILVVGFLSEKVRIKGMVGLMLIRVMLIRVMAAAQRRTWYNGEVRTIRWRQCWSQLDGLDDGGRYFLYVKGFHFTVDSNSYDPEPEYSACVSSP